MRKLWGRMSSINVRKVALTIGLLGLEVERVDAGREFGIVNSPAFLAKNPNAMIPLLEDGDFSLWESNVIVRYLCAQYGSTARDAEGEPILAYPDDLAARFDVERWMDWQQTTLNPAGRDAFVQLVRVPAAQRQQQLIDQSIAATEPLLDLLEAHLQGHSFIVGDRLGMADIPIACEMHRWWGLPLPRPARPRLQAWYDRMLALPAARGVLDLELS